MHDPDSRASTLTLLLGGVRSGKSARAVEMARAHAVRGVSVLFAATAQAFDSDMSNRIAAHQRERPSDWETVESPLELPSALAGAIANSAALAQPYGVVVVDCITLWTSNLLLALDLDADAEAEIARHVDGLLAVYANAAQTASPAHWIFVSNEVGLGVVPPTPLGRRYRDALGRANRILASAADHVTLMVAGLELRLK